MDLLRKPLARRITELGMANASNTVKVGEDAPHTGQYRRTGFLSRNWDSTPFIAGKLDQYRSVSGWRQVLRFSRNGIHPDWGTFRITASGATGRSLGREPQIVKLGHDRLS